MANPARRPATFTLRSDHISLDAPRRRATCLAAMHDQDDAPPPPRPTVTARAQADRQARLEREAAALRANLRKRKEQARARDDVKEDDHGRCS